MSVPPHSTRRGLTIVEVLIIIAVLALVFAQISASIQHGRGMREAARRTQCMNNLKQIGLALHNYAQTHGTLPPAYTVDAGGRSLHSWRTLILPYMDQQALYNTIDLSRPWNDPVNTTAAQTVVGAYTCPFRTAGPNTPYLANVSPTGALLPTAPRPLDDITDGVSNTLIIIEANTADAVPWMSPQDADPVLILGFAASQTAPHSHGRNAALVDGSVRFLKPTIRPETLRALITANGGETIPADAF